MMGYQEYFGETHRMVRGTVRKFVEREIRPFVDECEEQGKFPRELYRKAGDAGILGIGYPEDCRVPAEKLLGQGGQGFYGIMKNFQHERLQLSVMATMTALALEESLKYAREREAFGRPLTDFQVTRHKLADMATLVEASREFVYRVAAKIGAGESRVKEISMAKNFACMVSDQVTYDAVQIHGGAG